MVRRQILKGPLAMLFLLSFFPTSFWLFRALYRHGDAWERMLRTYPFVNSATELSLLNPVGLLHAHDFDNTGTALRAKLNDIKFGKSRKQPRKSATLKRPCQVQDRSGVPQMINRTVRGTTNRIPAISVQSRN